MYIRKKKLKLFFLNKYKVIEKNRVQMKKKEEEENQNDVKCKCRIGLKPIESA